MAKRQRYSQTPVVPRKHIAGANPVGNVTLGSSAPVMVPNKPEGFSHGFNIPEHRTTQPSVRGAKGFGHVAKRSPLRLSGNPGAHQVGKR